MRHTLKSAVLIACLLGATASHAAKAVFQASDTDGAAVLIETAANKLRASTEPDKGGYLIARDQRIYAVSTKGGREMVMDALQMLQLARHTGGALGMNFLDLDKYTRDIGGFVRLTDTQRQETVGGIAGTVHELVYTDGDGKQRMVELVMSTDPTLAAMTTQVLELAQAVHAVAATSGQEGVRQLAQEVNNRNLGLLRFGNDLTLQRLETAAVPENRFTLPQGAANLQQGLQGLQGLFK